MLLKDIVIEYAEKNNIVGFVDSDNETGLVCKCTLQDFKDDKCDYKYYEEFDRTMCYAIKGV